VPVFFVVLSAIAALAVVYLGFLAASYLSVLPGFMSREKAMAGGALFSIVYLAMYVVFGFRAVLNGQAEIKDMLDERDGGKR
jgi:predicted permease